MVLDDLQLALRHLSLQGAVTTFPDPQDHRVLARVDVKEGPPISESERRWFDAVPRRHTHRGSFKERPISPALAVHLQDAAETQGALLVYINDIGPRRRILHLARTAERLRAADPEAGGETGPRARVPPWPAAAAPDELPGRDFDLDREFGRLEDANQPPSAIAALVTDEDLAPDWLKAGRALEAVLLTAASEWSFAAIHSRVTEVPNLRAELRRELATAAHPQLLLRFGYADSAPATPRRPSEDVLDITN